MNNQVSTIAIQEMLDEWVSAICQGDMDRVLRHRAREIVMFDVPEPIQEKGLDAYRETWNLFFERIPAGPDRFRIGELNIIAGEDVGFAHGLLTIAGGRARCRLTLGFQKQDGEWRVMHEHHSMPLAIARPT